MYFNLKQTAILQAARLGKRPVFRNAKFFSKLLFTASLLFFTVFIYIILTEQFSEVFLNRILAGSLISFCFGFLFFELNLFFSSQLKKPKLEYTLYDFILRTDYLNGAAFLSEQAAAVIFKAQKIAKKHSLKEPTGQMIIKAIFTSKPIIKQAVFIADRADINIQALIQLCSNIIDDMEMSFSDIILTAAKSANKLHKTRITIGDLLFAIAEVSPFFIDFLVKNDLRAKDIANLSMWFERVETKYKIKKKFWLSQNLLQKGAFGRDFAAGFTITLDRYSTDLRSQIIKKGIRDIVGHQSEIEQVENVLLKRDTNNALLVGESGTGRSSVILAIAEKAFLGKSAEELNYKRFVEFNPSILASEIDSPEKAEKVLDQCFYEAVTAGNVVLIIKDFQQYIANQRKPGVINISAAIARYLPMSAFQIVAITTYDGLHNILEKNSSILNMFEKVEVREISEAETLMFLEGYVPFFEAKYKKFISYKALREIIRLSAKYMAQMPFPQKASRLLDEAIVYLKNHSKDKVLETWHIKKLVSDKTDIPVQALEQKEKQVLLNLENLIHQRIINQDEAVNQIADAMRRARADVSAGGGPIGNFLFLGPTGVGKTETAKALSHIYFGSEDKMIRLDMSEFQNVEDVKRLIGDSSVQGLLTIPVKESPFSLILLDEIEKAHPNILNLFLQVLDEGWITDGMGKKVDFQNTMIIATSNAGAALIVRDLKEDAKLDIIKDSLIHHLFNKNVFRPEFINRFDAVILFRPLSKQNLLNIAYLMLDKLAINLKDKGINFEITSDLQKKIAELGYNPSFGARELNRVIQDKVENVLAKAILSGQLKRGDRVEVNAANFELIFK